MAIVPVMLSRSRDVSGRKKVAAMPRIALWAGISFVSAFLGGVLAVSLAAAPHATAQSTDAQEVRASAFTLVSADGTVLATLAPNPISGAGILTLHDGAGLRRMAVAGTGVIVATEQDG